jgi:porphobilinogen deaminase
MTVIVATRASPLSKERISEVYEELKREACLKF